MKLFPNGIGLVVGAFFVSLVLWHLISVFATAALSLSIKPNTTFQSGRRKVFAYQITLGSLWLLVFGGLAIWNVVSINGTQFWAFAFGGAAAVPLLIVPTTIVALKRALPTKEGAGAI